MDLLALVDKANTKEEKFLAIISSMEKMNNGNPVWKRSELVNLAKKENVTLTEDQIRAHTTSNHS